MTVLICKAYIVHACSRNTIEISRTTLILIF